jgi:hypothetical protein
MLDDQELQFQWEFPLHLLGGYVKKDMNLVLTLSFCLAF